MTRIVDPAHQQELTRRAEACLKKHSLLLLGLFSITYLITTAYKASRKLYWFDELFTLHIARLPSLAERINAIRTQVDPNPPTFYQWPALSRLLIDNEAIAIRLPSILGFGILCLCLYRFVATATKSTTAAWVALLFPFITGATYDAYEARPHGIVLGLEARSP